MRSPHIIYWAILVSVKQIKSIWTGFDIIRQRLRSVKHDPFYVKINGLNNGGPKLQPSAAFGSSIANIGDINGDGVNDIIVGAPGEAGYIMSRGQRISQSGAGAVYILFMANNGSAMSYSRIGGNYNGGPTLYTNDQFGSAVANIGDLDGDGLNEIAVGAPGVVIASVYILFMNKTGTPSKIVLVRGAFESIPVPIGVHGGSVAPTPAPVRIFSNTSRPYKINGPPISYACSFGASLAGIGDLNGDGVPDFAAGASDPSGGDSRAYIIFMLRNGTVSHWATISPHSSGGPNLGSSFSNFGSSLALIGDLDGDGVPEMAIGARNEDDTNSVHYRSGAVFVCFMHRNGTVKKSKRISETADAADGRTLPWITNDECGTAVTSIGDINLDNMRQRRPTEVRKSPRKSIPDIITGCPQGNAGDQSGRIFLLFLEESGGQQGHTRLPDDEDLADFAPLQVHDQFGASLAAYVDMNGDNLKELLVGAPGTADQGAGSGAIYIITLHRRKYHKPPRCEACYWGMIVGLSAGILLCIIAAIAYFYWYFRRRPDIIEIKAKIAGVERTKFRARKKIVVEHDPAAYVEHYTT